MKENTSLSIRFIGLMLIITAFVSVDAAAQKINTKQLTAEYDRMLSEKFRQGETGCAALVAKDGQIIYKKAFGMADLELNVPMQPDMVFRIGSITKQFTAVAILQLMEQGKLSLQDDITKYIPDYPTHGYNITIEHLLTHTSGIKSYTNVPEFQKYVRQDMKPEEAINTFRNLPMEFAPGTKWNYNNSGYFLLGYIIEKVSGKTYQEYIEENFFKPLGMTGSCYGNDSRIIKNRASGYQPGKDGVQNADFLSMLLPYSAGAIQSTV
nr:beta-lactamase family protein [Bacteroidales bacterium]